MLALVSALILLPGICEAQIWARIVADNNLTIQAVSSDKIPFGGTFWSFQRTNYAPLPFNPFPDLPVYYLGYRNSYLIDDSTVDYAAIYQKREEDRLVRELEWKAGLVSTEEYFALEGGGSSMMMMSLSSSYAYGNPVYLTNIVATNISASAVTASFNISGGTNNVPYDILMSTNVATVVSNWNWIGIGYTSNRYTFSNQPLNQAFYILAKPQKTMVVGWGADDYQQSGLLMPLTNVLSVAGGRAHSLGLKSDGTVVGWGNNVYGQISVPTNLSSATMIGAGWYHSVALTTNGSVSAWGLNIPSFGYTMTDVPSDLTNAIVISAQGLHTLALRSNGLVTAWGNNFYSQTNVPASLSNVIAISAGSQHSLAVVSNGTVVAWGGNGFGQCNVPASLSGVVDVAAGNDHSLALKQDGTVVAWGDNSSGQTNVPAGLSNVVAIAAGGDPYNNYSYSMALKRDNTVAIWGSGDVVSQMIGMSNVIVIGGGAEHGLAVRSGPRTPVMTLLPMDQYQIPGGNVTFASEGVGLYGVTYQWKTNGVNFPGATNATFAVTNMQPTQAGSYSATISNELGTITSPNATLTLVTAPIILTQTPLPTNQVAIYHKYRTLMVVASAPGQANGFPLAYRWELNGTNIVGANNSSYTYFGDSNSIGNYTVIVTNAVGSVSASWQVTNITYVGSYLDAGTLAHHLATNLVARTNGHTPTSSSLVELSGWTFAVYYPTNLFQLTNSVWSSNFWLKGVQGLSATAIGVLTRPGGQGLMTMVSPRHCLFAEHMHHVSDRFVAAFLDTNNVIHWRTNIETVIVAGDLSVGIMNEDLPASVGYLPVIPTNYSNYIPTNDLSVVQGIGMNQLMKVFSQPMTFGYPESVFWNSRFQVPLGLTTNWSIELGGGDSSNPERWLIANQLVLVSHNYTKFGGPNYAFYFDGINEKMHHLSTNNTASSDYQLTPFSLTNWPSIH